MPNSSRNVPAVAWYAGLSFWLGGLPICIERAARFAFTGPQESYEHGLSGFFGGIVMRGIMWTGPALVFLVAVCIAVALFRRMATERAWQLCLFSGLLGLLSSGMFWLVWLGDQNRDAASLWQPRAL